jgi:ABC-2 type transport system ATP-binding protein
VHTRFTIADGTWVPALTALPGVSGVQYDGSSYDVSGDPSTPFLVAAALERGGCRPDDFTVVRPSLEDVFVALTQGGAR